MLKPSKKTALALEAVVDIAYFGGAEPVQSHGIAERLKLPRRYLEQVMQQLVRAGILKGVRGPRGGYRLARERRRVTVGEVMAELWEDIAADIISKLDAVTIHDLCEKAEQRKVRDEESGGVTRAPSFVI